MKYQNLYMLDDVFYEFADQLGKGMRARCVNAKYAVAGYGRERGHG